MAKGDWQHCVPLCAMPRCIGLHRKRDGITQFACRCKQWHWGCAEHPEPIPKDVDQA